MGNHENIVESFVSSVRGGTTIKEAIAIIRADREYERHPNLNRAYDNNGWCATGTIDLSHIREINTIIDVRNGFKP